MPPENYFQTQLQALLFFHNAPKRVRIRERHRENQTNPNGKSPKKKNNRRKAHECKIRLVRTPNPSTVHQAIDLRQNLAEGKTDGKQESGEIGWGRVRRNEDGTKEGRKAGEATGAHTLIRALSRNGEPATILLFIRLPEARSLALSLVLACFRTTRPSPAALQSQETSPRCGCCCCCRTTMARESERARPRRRREANGSPVSHCTATTWHHDSNGARPLSRLLARLV